MTAALQAEFGAEYRLADWNDLVAYKAQGNNIQELVDFLRDSPNTNTLGYSWISFNGIGIQSCCVSGVVPGQTLPRHYFVAAHDGSRPGSFAAFQTIDSAELDLGSWIRDYPILAITENLSTPSVPEPTTNALLALGLLCAGLSVRRRRLH